MFEQEGVIKIDISDEESISFWCQKWNVSKEALLLAVRETGDLAENVRRRLGL